MVDVIQLRVDIGWEQTKLHIITGNGGHSGLDENESPSGRKEIHFPGTQFMPYFINNKVIITL